MVQYTQVGLLTQTDLCTPRRSLVTAAQKDHHQPKTLDLKKEKSLANFSPVYHARTGGVLLSSLS
mgnify:CR=1 FL=1